MNNQKAKQQSFQEGTWLLGTMMGFKLASVPHCLARDNEDLTINLIRTGETICDPDYANIDSFNWLPVDSKA